MDREQKLPVILIVDDDPDIREMVKENLQQMQCVVLEASDGQEGLDMIVKNNPDLVLLDVMMPGLSGWEVAKIIRKDSRFDSMGIIMITALGEKINEMTSPLYGADDHIDKPFQLSELNFKIRRTLSKKRKLRQKSDSEVSPPQLTSEEENLSSTTR